MENKQQVIIMMKSRQITPDDDETIKLLTKGELEETDGDLLFTYEDTEATGFTGSVTKVRVSRDKTVTILRSGTSTSNLVLEPKRKHYCLYQTPFGSFTIGVLGKQVSVSRKAQTGMLALRYQLDMEGTFLSENIIELLWRPQHQTESDAAAG